jgi:uncharacterized membrane protein
MHRQVTCLLMVCVALGSASFAQTQPTFDFVEIRFPGAMTTNATGINNFGSIVGSYSIDGHSTHGYKLTNQHFLTINFPGSNTFVHGINNNGDVVGFFTLPGDLKLHGFLRLRNGTFKRLDAPGAFEGTIPSGVNNALKVVGAVDNSAFTWQNGAFRLIAVKDPAGTAGTTRFNAIANTGWIAGGAVNFGDVRGFIVRGSDFDWLSPQGTFTEAEGINGRGDVVGCSQNGAYIAFNPEASDTNEQVEKFPTIFPVILPGKQTICAFSINFFRAIVGSYSDAQGLHAFMAVTHAQ